MICPSHEISFVTAGQRGQFKIDSSKESSLNVRIVGISPLVDARTGTASAELEFITEIDKKTTDTTASVKINLPPIGSIGQAVFEISQGTIMMIPEASLIYQDGKPMVRVLKGKDQVDKKSIELGDQRDSSYVVKSGIAQGDKVVVRSSRPLKENELIEIESAPVTTQ